MVGSAVAWGTLVVGRALAVVGAAVTRGALAGGGVTAGVSLLAEGLHAESITEITTMLILSIVRV
jgi:hypothetical protein